MLLKWQPLVRWRAVQTQVSCFCLFLEQSETVQWHLRLDSTMGFWWSLLCGGGTNFTLLCRCGYQICSACQICSGSCIYRWRDTLTHYDCTLDLVPTTDFRHRDKQREMVLLALNGGIANCELWKCTFLIKHNSEKPSKYFWLGRSKAGPAL